MKQGQVIWPSRCYVVEFSEIQNVITKAIRSAATPSVNVDITVPLGAITLSDKRAGTAIVAGRTAFDTIVTTLFAEVIPYGRNGERSVCISAVLSGSSIPDLPTGRI